MTVTINTLVNCIHAKPAFLSIFGLQIKAQGTNMRHIPYHATFKIIGDMPPVSAPVYVKTAVTGANGYGYIIDSVFQSAREK